MYIIPKLWAIVALFTPAQLVPVHVPAILLLHGRLHCDRINTSFF